MLNSKTGISSLALAALLAGCGAGDGTSADADTIARDEFNSFGMLLNMADNVIIPGYAAVDAPFTTLAADIDNYCSAIDGTDETTRRATAQSAFTSALSTYQATEAYLVGPAADNSGNLRNRIYSFGVNAASPCGIDLGVVLNQSDVNNINSLSNGSRGLGAIEYLLFSDNLDTQCSSNVQALDGWDELPDSERKAQRCDYAQTVASDIQATLNTVQTTWNPEGGNYRSTFIDPDAVGGNISAVSDALITFVDQELKDKRLGAPLERCTDNAFVDCSDYTEVESPLSNNSYANIKAGLQSVEAVLFGKDGISFDDLISSVGQDSVNQGLQQNITGAISLIDSLSSTLEADVAAAITNDQAVAECDLAISSPSTNSSYPACQLFGYVKAVSDSLKTEFIAATALDLPDRAQSDND